MSEGLAAEGEGGLPDGVGLLEFTSTGGPPTGGERLARTNATLQRPAGGAQVSQVQILSKEGRKGKGFRRLYLSSLDLGNDLH